MEVIDTNSGISHLFVCGRWLSRGAAEHREPDGSNLDENDGVKLERVDGSESDIRVCLLLLPAKGRFLTCQVLYRFHYLVYSSMLSLFTVVIRIFLRTSDLKGAGTVRLTLSLFAFDAICFFP